MTVQSLEQFKILLDSEADESYATDLTSRLMHINWHNGCHAAYEFMATKNSATLILDNADGELSTDLFGDFSIESRTETITAEALTNGSFTAWTGATPDNWTKIEATLAVTQTASGGGAGTGSAHITGASGYASLAQNIEMNRDYEVTVVISQFSGDGVLKVNLADSADFIIRDTVVALTASGTHTFRLTTVERRYFELYAERVSGTFTVTIDSVSVKRVDVTYGTVSQVEQTILGPDMLTNSSFTAWGGGLPTGWSSLHSATVSEAGTGQDHTGAGTGSVNLYTNPDAQSDIYQPVGTTSDSDYRIDIVVSLLDPGVTLHIGGYTSLLVHVFSATLTTAGTHTFFIHVGTVLPVYFVIFHNSSSLDATIDSVTFKPVTFITQYVRGEVSYTIAPDATVTHPRMTKRGSLIKILASYQELTNRQYWIGKLRFALPAVGKNGEKTVELELTDWADQLLDVDFQADYLENTTADAAIIAALMKSKTVTYPYANSFWLWGSQGSAVMGISTTFYALDTTGFDVGDYVFPLIGDNTQMSDHGTNLQAYTRDVLTAENGDCRFFWDGRTSRFVFHRRRRDILQQTVSGLFLPDSDGEITDGHMATTDELRNVQTVYYQPRSVGSPLSTLYTNPSVPIALNTGQKMELTVRYTDPSVPSARVGGKDFTVPARNLDYAFNLQSDGLGADISSRGVISVQFAAASARIILRNTYKRTIYCTLLQLRGTPIKTYTPTRVMQRDALSIEGNDYHAQDMQALFVSSQRDAESLANYLLSKFKNPLRRLQRITFRAENDYLIRQSLNRVIGDRIHVRDAHNQHEADYIVVGEAHEYDADNASHDVTYILKPASQTVGWIWGTSRMGLDTIFVF